MSEFEQSSVESRAQPAPALELIGARKAYGARVAVAGLDLAVDRGRTLGLLGPNGAGKSTTMHLIAGLLRADAGRVRVLGRDDPTRASVRRRLGIAPQELALYGNLTAEENLRFFARLHGLRGRRLADRIDWALDLAGLSSRRADRVRTFSGGMARRLNLACAAVHEPELLLLDEPTVGVDPQSRNHLFESIETLARAGTTVVYSTHYMEEATRLCDRVAIIDAGRVLAYDTVPALVAAHGGSSFVEAEVAHVPAGVSLPAEPASGMLRCHVERPLDVLAELGARGVRFRAVSVREPNLEGVFLALTGKTLRD